MVGLLFFIQFTQSYWFSKITFNHSNHKLNLLVKDENTSKYNYITNNALCKYSLINTVFSMLVFTHMDTENTCLTQGHLDGNDIISIVTLIKD